MGKIGKGGSILDKFQNLKKKDILTRFGRLITKTPTFCLCCGEPLENRKPGQIQKYCSKTCRKSRPKNS